MAEALGVIASGIALAQIAGTAAGAVVKLKKLWDEEAEQQVIQNQLPPQLWDDAAAIRSTKYCRKALQKLTCVAEDLASQIHSRRRIERGVSRTKILLKKDALQKLEQRLGNAVGMLQLAQQGYLITLVKHQPDVIVSKVISELETARQPNSLSPARTTKEFEPDSSADLDILALRSRDIREQN
ncbi:hypothetical protein F5B19DRAFT_489975 [Rostrohypoxylon terebratum]|nr:hypothetical protein F5B19DRAFT_489975 [Rostrohypoxylon terebratum]